MDKDEEYVRGIWELVHRCDGSYHGYPRGTILVQDTRGHWLNFRSEAEAADFTREHEEQVRQLREEIVTLNTLRNQDLKAAEFVGKAYGDFEYVQEFSAHFGREAAQLGSVCSRLEAELSKLTAGMKKEVEG